MRIAVTGASGYLGQRVVERALAQGFAVRALQRHPHASASRHVDWVPGDLASPEALRTLLAGADVLVHLAAIGVRSNDRHWDAAFQVNTTGAVNVMVAAAAAGVRRAVVTGSWIEYSGHGSLPDHPVGGGGAPLCTEHDRTEPIGAYGATKAAGGLLARALARESNLPLWYLRLASVYGPADYPTKVLPAALDAALAARAFPMSGGAQVRDWVHVDDAADAIIRAAATPPPGDAAIANVGTGEPVVLADLVPRVFRLAGAPESLVQIGVLPYRRHEPHHLVLDPSAVHRVLDWSGRRLTDAELSKLIEATVQLHD